MKNDPKHIEKVDSLAQKEVQSTPITELISSDNSENGDSPTTPPSDSPDSSDDSFVKNPYLPESFQKRVERQFGHDFSNVNIYKNSAQAEENWAKAFTQGNNIHFAQGEFNPYHKDGQNLLTHEFNHVVQQRENRVNSSSYDALEQEATNSELALSYSPKVVRNKTSVQKSSIQFKKKISRGEIEEIRTLLNTNETWLAYKLITQKLGKKLALHKFLSEYKDIGTNLLIGLKQLSQTEDKAINALIIISKYAYIPVKGIDSKSEESLIAFKANHQLENIESIANQHQIDLHSLLVQTGFSSEQTFMDLPKFIIKIEKTSPPKYLEKENVQSFISHLNLLNTIESIERQANPVIDLVKIAEDEIYYVNAGYMKGFNNMRDKNLKVRRSNKRMELKNATNTKEKQNIRKAYRKKPKDIPSLLTLAGKILKDSGVVIVKNIKLSELEEITGNILFGGVSFDQDTIIDQIKIDLDNLTMTIDSSLISLNFLDSSDKTGGIKADQINLYDNKITLRIHKTGKSPFAEESDINFGYSNVQFTAKLLDLHNLRIQDKSSTLALGRFRIENLSFTFNQVTNSRNVQNYFGSYKATYLINLLSETLLKGPMISMPIVNNILGKILATSKVNNEIDLDKLDEVLSPANLMDMDLMNMNLMNVDDLLASADKQTKSDAFNSGMERMLAQDLFMDLEFDKITIDNYFQTDNSLSEEQIAKGKLPHIKKIELGEKGGPKSSVKIASHQINQSEIDEAKKPENIKHLNPEVQKIVLDIKNIYDYNHLTLRFRMLGDDYDPEISETIVRDDHKERYDQYFVQRQINDIKKKTVSKNILVAAKHFEVYRNFSFETNVPSGKISGGELLENLIIPKIKEGIESFGTIQSIEGIGETSFKNFNVKSTQSSQGIEWIGENQLSLDVEIPTLIINELDMNITPHSLQAEKIDLTNTTVSVALTFLPEDKATPESQYDISVKEIKAKKAEVINEVFSYNKGQAGFKSSKAIAYDLGLKLDPILAPTNIEFSFCSLELYNSSATFGSHSIQSEPKHPIILHEGEFKMSPKEMNFTLKDLEFEGNYSDGQFNKIDFKHGLNKSDERGPLIQYHQNADSSQKLFKLNMNSSIELPKVCLNLGDNKYLKIGSDAKPLTVENIYVDLEFYENSVLVNEVSIGKIKSKDYELVLGTESFTNEKLGGLLLEKLSVKNLKVETVSTPTILPSTFNLNNETPLHPNQIKSLENTDLHPDLRPVLDKTPITEGVLLTDKTETLLKRIAPDKNVEVLLGNLALNNLSAKNLGGKPGIHSLIKLFTLGNVSLSSINGLGYSIENIHRLLAHREIESFATEGTIEKEKGKKKEFLGSWQLKTETGKKIVSDYDEETNISTFDGLPNITLNLKELDFHADGFSLTTLGKEKPVEIENIQVGKITLNHKTNEILIPKLKVGSISGNGLKFNHYSLGWNFKLNDNQRASVNGLSFTNWKTTTTDSSKLSSIGPKSEININSILIPSLVADMNLKKDEKPYGNAKTTLGIGPIKFKFYANGKQSLSAKNIGITDSEFNLANESIDIQNMLKSLTADEIYMEMDTKGHKSLKAVNPVITQYEMNLGKKIVKADLHCTGTLRIYEGNYESFVHEMDNMLSEFGSNPESKMKGIDNAWLVDASECLIELKNIGYTQQVASDPRNAKQKALEDAYMGNTSKNKQDHKNPSGSLSNPFSLLKMGEIKSNLETISFDKLIEGITANKKIASFADLTHLIESIEGSIDIGIFNQTLNIGIKDGSIDFSDLKDGIEGLLASWFDNILRADLYQTEGLRRFAVDSLNYIKTRSYGDAMVAGMTAVSGAGMILGGIIGFATGGPMGAVIGVQMGMAFGAVAGAGVGVGVGAAGRYYADWVFDEILQQIVPLLEAMSLPAEDPNSDYRPALINVLDWFMKHLVLLDYSNHGQELSLRIKGNFSPKEGESNVTEFNLLQIGGKNDTHVNFKDGTIHLAGLIKYFMTNLPNGNLVEEGILEQIEELEKENFSAHQIITKILHTSDLVDVENDLGLINGLSGMISGKEFGEVNENAISLIQSFLMSRIQSVTLDIENIELAQISDWLNKPLGESFNWLGGKNPKASIKGGLMENSNFSPTSFQNTNQQYGSNLTLSDIPGFVYDKRNFAVGMGKTVPAQVDVDYGQKDESGITSEVKAEQEQGTFIQGFQAAYRKEALPDIKPIVRKPWKSKNNSDPNPRCNGIDDKNIIQTYRDLTNQQDIQYIFAANDAFIFRDELVLKKVGDLKLERNPLGTKVAVIRFTNRDKKKKINNYMGYYLVTPGQRPFTRYEPNWSN